jgi:hypothetical protein
VNFVENIGVREERAEAGFGAEQDRPVAIFGVGKIAGICVAKDPPAKSDESPRLGLIHMPDGSQGIGRHHFTSAMKTSNAPIWSFFGLRSVYDLTALENRICKVFPLISRVREKLNSSFVLE